MSAKRQVGDVFTWEQFGNDIHIGTYNPRTEIAALNQRQSGMRKRKRQQDSKAIYQRHLELKRLREQEDI